MKLLKLLILILLFTTSVNATPTQAPSLKQSGAVTADHCVKWLGNNVLADSGASCGDADSITGSVSESHGGTSSSTVLTEGSVVFKGATGYTQDNASLNFNDSTDTLTAKNLTLTNPLSVASGGIGLSTLGDASTCLKVNADKTALEYGACATGAGSMVYPAAGISVSTGSAWGTSLATGTTGNSVILQTGSDGKISASVVPTLNQNTSGSAASFTGNLVGDVTGTQGATSIAASTVTGKAITGFSAGAGTVAGTDTILQAINKIVGNIAGKEAALGNPDADGKVLSSTASGTRSWVAAGAGSGTVNSGTTNKLAYYAGNGTAVSPLSISSSLGITGSTLGLTTPVNFYTEGHTIAASEAAGALIYNSTTAGTFSLPQAGTEGFGSGVSFNFMNINTGSLSIQTTTSTISGTTLVDGKIVLPQYGYANCISDSINWNCSSNLSTGFAGSLSGDVTGTQGATSIAATTVTGKALTNFSASAGVVSATDTILQAFNKIVGNLAGKEASLGNPDSDGKVLASTASGTRSWVDNGGGSMVYPDSGVPVSTGSAWGTSLTAGETGNSVLLKTGSDGKISASVVPTLNQNTSGSAASFTGNLVGDVTGTQGATSIAATTVTGKALTNFSASAGVVSATDTILQAFNKIVGNIAGKEPALGNPSASGYVLSSTDAGVRSWVAPAEAGSMTYPGAGVPVSTGSAWGTSLTAGETGSSVLLKTGSGGTINASVVPTLNQNTTGSAGSLSGATFAAPGAIGGTTPAAAAFTTLAASSTVTFSGISGSTQCLHVNSSGVVSGTGSDCGSGSGTMVYPDSGIAVSTGSAWGTSLTAGETGNSVLLKTASNGKISATVIPSLSYEPAAGNPSSDGYVLSSTAAGVRSWVPQSGSGSRWGLDTDEISIYYKTGPVNLGPASDTASSESVLSISAEGEGWAESSNGIEVYSGLGKGITIQADTQEALYAVQSGGNYPAVYGYSDASANGIGGKFKADHGYALITSGGNVGIGTNSPASLLTVNGTAAITTLNLTNDLALTEGGTGASTAVAALASLAGGPAAGTYTVKCTSTTSCELEAFGTSAAGLVSLSTQDQAFSGGVDITSYSNGTKSSGTYTVDCGKGPLQYLTNGGAFTLAAPSADGSCMVFVTNNSSAGAITFSGFKVGATTGDFLTTTDTHKFSISIWRINGTSGYRIAAHQ